MTEKTQEKNQVSVTLNQREMEIFEKLKEHFNEKYDDLDISNSQCMRMCMKRTYKSIFEDC